MHLPDAGDVDQREQAFQFKLRAGFFLRFTGGALGHGLVEFHEPGPVLSNHHI
jgi:hypothetical protein